MPRRKHPLPDLFKEEVDDSYLPFVFDESDQAGLLSMLPDIEKIFGVNPLFTEQSILKSMYYIPGGSGVNLEFKPDSLKWSGDNDKEPTQPTDLLTPLS